MKVKEILLFTKIQISIKKENILLEKVNKPIIDYLQKIYINKNYQKIQGKYTKQAIN